MAINNTNTQAPSVKKYVDYANQQVDEQAILDKYNAATLAQFNIQREQNRQAENQFYNQMYNTQKTAMDTIRQSNAAAVSTGASRGVQAANELSSLLGLQSESIASATELAQANRQTAQEETAAVLENVLNAYQQAQQERSQLVSQGIEAASVDAQQAANQVAAAEAQTEHKRYMMDLKINDPDMYNRTLAAENNATDFVNMTEQQYTANVQNATQALSELEYNIDNVVNKTDKEYTSLLNIYTAYGMTQDELNEDIAAIQKDYNVVTAAKDVGSSALQIGGMASGAAVGAAIGSVIPGVGTAIGAFFGTALGFIAGKIGGDAGLTNEAKKAMNQYTSTALQTMLAVRYQKKYSASHSAQPTL